MRRWIIVLIVLVCSPRYLLAQAPPRAETQAAVLQDLSQRVGQPLSLASFSSQQWFFGPYAFVRDLGCVGAPAAPPVMGGWQRFEYVYQNTTYVYLISDDARALVLCNEAALPTAVPQSATLPAFTPLPTSGSAVATSQPATPMPSNTPVPIVQTVIATPLPCALSPRLEIGTSAAVTPGEPNWVHRQPARSTEKLGEIPGGEQVTVLDGPRCDLATQMNYWQVDYDGLIGWTSEGLNGEYWLEPIVVNRPSVPFAADTLRRALPPPWLENYASGADVLAAVSPDAAWLVLGDDAGQVDIWDLRDNRFVNAIDRQSPITALALGDVMSFALAVGAADGTVYVQLGVSEATPAFTTRMYQHTSIVTALAIVPGGTLLVVGDGAGRLTFWDVADANVGESLLQIQLPEAAGKLAFSADGAMLLVYDNTGFLLTALQVPQN